jgi:hypothetical protein
MRLNSTVLAMENPVPAIIFIAFRRISNEYTKQINQNRKEIRHVEVQVYTTNE